MNSVFHSFTHDGTVLFNVNLAQIRMMIELLVIAVKNDVYINNLSVIENTTKYQNINIFFIGVYLMLLFIYINTHKTISTV